MGKQAKRQKVRVKRERQVERARAKFEAMQEQYLLVREQGKQQVQKAQLEADRKLTKVNEQLQKRAEALSRAEERMVDHAESSGLGSAQTGSSMTAAAATPNGVADAIEQRQMERSDSLAGNALTVSDGM